MNSNILDDFFEVAQGRPGAIALFQGEQTWSYGGLVEAVQHATRGLREAGAFTSEQPVPRIGLCCPNGVAHVVWALAVIHGGGCLVPVPLELTSFERDELVGKTALHALVLAGGAEIWGVWDEPVKVCEGDLLADVFFNRDCGGATFSEDAFSGLSPALIRFSSGTTGESKGVVLSHGSLDERIQSANRRLEITREDRVLWTLPMAHHFAVSILLYLKVGAGVVLADAKFGEEMLEVAERWNVTVIYGAPFHMRLLSSAREGRCWNSLRLAVSTATGLSKEIADRFYARYGKWLSQGFGIIEAGLPFLNTGAGEGDVLTVGRPNDFEVWIDYKQGVVGEIGELCLRGPGMFDAYLSPWKLRAEVMSDGWFHTGDLAKRHSDGRIEICGRIKSVLNIGGMKCFPEEIESVLVRVPGVKTARVFGELNERWGTLVVAEVVRTEEGEVPSRQALLENCRRFLAAYKVPSRFEFVEDIPRTASGKIRR